MLVHGNNNMPDFFFEKKLFWYVLFILLLISLVYTSNFLNFNFYHFFVWIYDRLLIVRYVNLLQTEHHELSKLSLSFLSQVIMTYVELFLIVFFFLKKKNGLFHLKNIEKYFCWSLWFLWTECYHFVRFFHKLKNFQHVFVFQMFFHCLFFTYLIFQTYFLFLFPSGRLLVKSYVNCFWVFFIFLNCLNCF